MNCQDFWNTMPELDRHGEYSGHLRECTACAARWEGQRSLVAGLRAAAHNRDKFRASAEKEREKLKKVLLEKLPEVLLNEASTVERQAPNIFNLSFPGRDTDYLVALLDELLVLLWSGHVHVA